jgi:hypothetical protein
MHRASPAPIRGLKSRLSNRQTDHMDPRCNLPLVGVARQVAVATPWARSLVGRSCRFRVDTTVLERMEGQGRVGVAVGECDLLPTQELAYGPHWPAWERMNVRFGLSDDLDIS